MSDPETRPNWSALREPVGTYRLQLHAGFTLDDAAELAGYLAELGVSHAYTSPLLAAVPGSTHGYDVVDPSRFDDERGGEAAYLRFSGALTEHGLGHLLDVVPNHMAAAPPHNPWWWDVLRRGRDSRYARFFDIDWEPDTPELAGRVLVPVLGRPLKEAVGSGEVTVDVHEGEPAVRYYEHVLPLRLEPEENRPEPSDESALAVGEGLSPERLLEILDRQPYRLAHWRRARGELNYRRFFDISDLVALRQVLPEVFDATHELVLELVRRGHVDGLRVDHVDGLRDPEGYLERLSRQSGGTWVVVEKILEEGEELRPEWATAGTTGYELAALAGGLLVDPRGREPMLRLWQEITGGGSDWEEVTRRARLDVLDRVLPAELERLTQVFSDFLAAEERPADPESVAAVVRETLASFPVYRTYVRGRDRKVTGEDRRVIAEAVARAKRARTELPIELFDRLEAALSLEAVPSPDAGEGLAGQAARTAAAELAERFQQVSGPVMAKGVEDTSFYRFFPLASLCEVGDTPGRFGVPPEAFHAFCRTRAERWPRALSLLSSHDSKRSADVRARLALLSEIPERWGEAVRRWRRLAERHRRGGLPDPAMEYLLYQTLVGTWTEEGPLETEGPAGADGAVEPVERAALYLEKAAREAKVHTTWTRRDEEYEAALRGFVEGVLGDDELTREIGSFARPLIGPGRVASLALQLLALAAPGVPDLYQGTELWSLTLVDPDNRRPVGFERRRRLLAELPEGEPTREDLESILARWEEGLPKLWLIRQGLALRRRRPGAFGPGSGHRPLTAEGEKAEHAVAFLRSGRLEQQRAVAVVPRLVLGLGDGWGDTSLALPPGRWRNVLTGEALDGGRVPVAMLLRRFPVALLEDRTDDTSEETEPKDER